MKERISILVVCTGNICRSPTGEGVLRHLARARGLADRITVRSAGTHDYHVGERQMLPVQTTRTEMPI